MQKEEGTTIMAAIEVAQLNQKPQKTSSYACHICGLNGHKIKNLLKFY
jgi:hypothetical protein